MKSIFHTFSLNPQSIFGMFAVAIALFLFFLGAPAAHAQSNLSVEIQPFCEEGFRCSFSADVDGGDPNLIIWKLGDDTTRSGNFSSLDSINHTYEESGDYTVKVTVQRMNVDGSVTEATDEINTGDLDPVTSGELPDFSGLGSGRGDCPAGDGIFGVSTCDVILAVYQVDDACFGFRRQLFDWVSHQLAVLVQNVFLGTEVPVGDAAVRGETSRNSQKERCLDSLTKMSAKEVLNDMQTKATEWIKGKVNDTLQPRFVENLGKHLRNTAETTFISYLKSEHPRALQRACGVFNTSDFSDLQGVIRGGLESEFNRQFAEATGIYQESNQNIPGSFGSLGCDLEEQFSDPDDLKRFLEGDFTRGGWEAYATLLTDPASNPRSVMQRARSDLTRTINERIGEEREIINQGGGFLPDRRCPGGNPPNTKNGLCPNGEPPSIATPGSITKDIISGIIGGDQERAQLADEYNETATGLATSLFGSVLQRGLRYAEGVINRESSGLDEVDLGIQGVRNTLSTNLPLFEEHLDVCEDIYATAEFYDLDGDGSRDIQDDIIEGDLTYRRIQKYIDDGISVQNPGVGQDDVWDVGTVGSNPRSSSTGIFPDLYQCIQTGGVSDINDVNAVEGARTDISSILDQCVDPQTMEDIITRMEIILYGEDPSSDDYSVNITAGGTTYSSSGSAISPPEFYLQECQDALEGILDTTTYSIDNPQVLIENGCDYKSGSEIQNAVNDNVLELSEQQASSCPIDQTIRDSCDINVDFQIGVTGSGTPSRTSGEARPRNSSGTLINNPDLSENEVDRLQEAADALVEEAESAAGGEITEATITDRKEDFAELVNLIGIANDIANAHNCGGETSVSVIDIQNWSALRTNSSEALVSFQTVNTDNHTCTVQAEENSTGATGNITSAADDGTTGTVEWEAQGVDINGMSGLINFIITCSGPTSDTQSFSREL